MMTHYIANAAARDRSKVSSGTAGIKVETRLKSISAHYLSFQVSKVQIAVDVAIVVGHTQK